MAKKILFFSILLLIVFSIACKKKIPCKIYNFSANKYYTGSQAISAIKAKATVTDADSGITIEVAMQGGNVSLEYPVHIHVQDLAEPYGYSGNPVIGVEHIHNGQPTSTFTTKYTYKTFTENFKGYLVIHDPTNVINDTLSHVVFGKIGSW
jgi:hypothetical protein